MNASDNSSAYATVGYSSPARPMPKGAGAILLMVGLLLEGCTFATLRQELSELSNYVVVSGEVARDGTARAPAVVALYCDEGGHYRVAGYKVLMKPGGV